MTADDRQGCASPRRGKVNGVSSRSTQFSQGLSVLIGVCGAVAIFVSYTSLRWISGDTYPDEAPMAPMRFDQIKALTRAADAFGGGDSFSSVYFGGLAWVLAVLCVAALVMSLISSGGQRLARRTGIVIALLSIALTVRSLLGGAFDLRLNQVYPGLWVAAAGFLLLGAAFYLAPSTTSVNLDDRTFEPRVTESSPPTPQLDSDPRAQVYVRRPTAVTRSDSAEPDATSPSVAFPSPTIAAGWHPDPLGRFEVRYWNGNEWTSHVMNAQQPSLDPIAP